jgi:hypothetical protein
MWLVVTNESGPDSVVQVEMAHGRFVSRWTRPSRRNKQVGRNISCGLGQSDGLVQPLSTAWLPSVDI